MELKIQTEKKKQVLDITALIEQTLPESDGICNIFVLHTTCCVTTADLDPGTDQDTLDFLEKLIPQINFRHPHNPEHAPDHIISSIIGPSLSIPFKNGKLVLGTWQSVILIELDGPRERNLQISILLLSKK
jgi:secondary thiamine-phosphate synthase enzyme